MRIATKIIGIAASAALVAGAGAISVVPAQAAAAPKVTGKTIIDLKPAVAGALAAAGVGIRVTAPATFATSPKILIGFPVTGATATTVTHSGAVTFYSALNPAGVPGENPIITLGAGNTATITVSVGGTAVPLLDVKHVKTKSSSWKIDKSHKKWVVKRTTSIGGDVHLTSSQGIVDLVNEALGVTVFKAGMGMGTTRVTVNETANCKSNTVKGCKVA